MDAIGPPSSALQKAALDIRSEALQMIQRIRNNEGPTKVQTEVEALPSAEFGSSLSKAINEINQTQQNSKSIQHQYATGVSGVSLSDVVLSSQKADLSFRLMLNVRNKAIDAYNQIMSMSV
jgi:flagellar hook-basal body complex protein FliE